MIMEITELNLIGDFEAGIKCLQIPSLFSAFSPLLKLPQSYTFWTLGALILAVFASFTNIFNRIKFFIHQIRLKFLLSYQKSCAQNVFSDDDFEFDFSDDDTPSSVAESDDEEYNSEDYERTSKEIFRAEGSSFRGKNKGQDGNFTLRRHKGFPLSDFSAGKSVVQLWDSFGLGLDFEDDDDFRYGSEIAIWDLDRDLKISSGWWCDVPATATASVVLTAEMSGGDGGVEVGAYDARVDGKAPAIYAEWKPRRRKVAGGEKVTTVDGEMWWEADGVIGGC